MKAKRPSRIAEREDSSVRDSLAADLPGICAFFLLMICNQLHRRTGIKKALHLSAVFPHRIHGCQGAVSLLLDSSHTSLRKSRAPHAKRPIVAANLHSYLHLLSAYSSSRFKREELSWQPIQEICMTGARSSGVVHAGSCTPSQKVRIPSNFLRSDSHTRPETITHTHLRT